MNKIDLAEDRTACEQALRPYAQLGYRVLLTSAVRGEGIDELRQMLRDRMTVLAGLSGVGKSSLLAAVQPGLSLRIAETSVRRHEGRHTTTQVSLLKLEMGGLVADTPGIREFGLSGLRKAELAAFYPEILAQQGGCQFANCSHRHEPGCAVQDAVRRGRVSAMRYDSYQKIYDTLPD
jgi:ribosome biogenesis GTPase